VIFYWQNFIIGILGIPSEFNFEEFKKVASGEEEAKVITKSEVQFVNKTNKKAQDKIITKDILSFSIIGKNLRINEAKEYLKANGADISE